MHLAYTKLDMMLEHLKNCSAVKNRAPLKHGGPLGKFLLVGGISGIVTFPGFYLKHGGVNIEDLRNFPPRLKQKLAILQWPHGDYLRRLQYLLQARSSAYFIKVC